MTIRKQVSTILVMSGGIVFIIGLITGDGKDILMSLIGIFLVIFGAFLT